MRLKTSQGRSNKKRAAAHFSNVPDALKALGLKPDDIDVSQISVGSQFFEVLGRVRLGESQLQERSLVERRGMVVLVLARSRMAP